MQIVFNGQTKEVTDGLTVAELLAQLEMASNRCAVEVNMEVVPRTAHDSHVLRDGDQLEIVTLVGGG